jgi:HD superfamily phosphohydrolase
VKRIFDPIHHFIELDDGEVALLNAAPVQRLRRLRQLGLAYLAFPAAEHSRFGHALGALAMGERVLRSLRGHDDGYFASEDDFRAQRRLLRASLLLHDVGHGPFSHACEAVLGVPHERRTEEIVALPAVEAALDLIGVDPEQVLALIEGDPLSPYPVLRELVSGPNLDADRMDYLLRDGYFTGVVNARYDADQLIGSLRVYDRFGKPVLGVDGRGLVALESFVLARYMMFSTVYFHHTTRQFERTLQEALRELWRDPRALDPIDEFLQWDDFRVLEAMRFATEPAARGVRERETRYALVAEFNAEGDLSLFEACHAALRERYGDAVWADTQEQLMHRLPLVLDGRSSTVFVRTHAGITDAREASDLIARITGKVYWRKLFVARARVDVVEARALARSVTADRTLDLFTSFPS